MKKVRLSAGDFDNLVCTLSEHKEIVSHLKGLSSDDGHGVTLMLDSVTCNKVGDLLTEELAKTGFDEDYELTQCGEVIEALIDVFNMS